MKRVFCIGNGESRKGFDLNKLRPFGKIYGCNALYREFTPDVLIAVDQGMMHEIYHSGYAYNNECWFRNWTHRRAVEYRQAFYGVGCDISDSEIKTVKKYFTNIKENEKGDSEKFVLHGTPIKNVLSALDKNLKTIKDVDINSEFTLKSKLHHLGISWIRKKGDRAHTLEEIMENRKDLGWSSGSTSGYIACKQEQPNEVYLIGHDFSSNTKHINNLYKGTNNYAKATNKPTPGTNWINQWKKLFNLNPKIKFLKVNDTLEDNNVNKKIKEWKGIKNIEYTTYDKCIFNR